LLNLREQKCVFSSVAKFIAGIRSIIHIKSVIEKNAMRLKSQGANGTLLSELIFATNEDGSNKLTHTELMQNAIALTFAGYKTTECVLSLAAFLLGLHPTVWTKVVKEQKNFSQNMGIN